MFDAHLVENKRLIQGPITGSGSIVTFDSLAEAPLSKLLVNIDPVQEGSGDPSPTNVRPISGWTGARVQQTKENLVGARPVGTTTNNGITFVVGDDGRINISGTATANATRIYPATSYNNMMQFFPKGTYTVIARGFVGQNTGDRIVLNVRYADNTLLVDSRISEASGQIPDGTGRAVTFTAEQPFHIGFFVNVQSGTTIDSTVEITMHRGSTVGDWTPYTPTLYNITWSDTAGTVYGGYVDVVNGKLTQTWGGVDLGSLNWTLNSSGAFVSQTYVDKKEYSAARVQPILCSIFAQVTDGRTYAETPDNTIYNGGNNNYLYVKSSAYSTAAELKAAMNGVMAYYELATPIEYDIDPVTIQTLLGQNNIWADCGSIESLKVGAVRGALKIELIES